MNEIFVGDVKRALRQVHNRHATLAARFALDDNWVEFTIHAEIANAIANRINEIEKRIGGEHG